MDRDLIKLRLGYLAPVPDERLRLIFAAAEAAAIGYGGISVVSRETEVSRRAVALGLKELGDPDPEGFLPRRVELHHLS